MLATILEDGYLFLAAGAITILAAVIRLLLGISYAWWVHAAYSMEWEGSKSMADLKEKFHELVSEDLKSNYVNIFVDKHLNTRKICGLYLSTWESISGQARLLCCVIAVSAVGIGRYYECGQNVILSTVFMSLGGIALLYFVDNFTALTAKKERFKVNLSDYFMVCMKNKELETEYAKTAEDVEAEALLSDDGTRLYEDYTAKEYNKKVVKAEKKLIEIKKKAEEKAVFQRVKEQEAKEKREKRRSSREFRQQAEQEAMAEMRKRREEKQQERKQRVLEELRQQAIAEAAEKEAQLAAAKSETEEEPAVLDKAANTPEISAGNIAAAETAAAEAAEISALEKNYPVQVQNKIIADVLKQFL